MDNVELAMKTKPNPLLDKSYAFALSIVNLCYSLQDERREYILSKQLLRSGTSVGALSEEAQQAESKADFIHKLSIANKEAHESHYWLRLIRDSNKFDIDVAQYLAECEELKRLLISIIKSSRR
ncbi:MAG: four helix bundle protein [Flammeovirgaceae bacterium]|nr:four helix bundle protein [Flammeovirgaceae bacterium]MBE61574.1 four helix bundle protein [Flammeovirgaceae bacterium]MBR10059.1 four helix bundle protein [Rickettsiales bacterium]HCX22975.1 four helix bundle protein [Cytophagales bacterium]|tara:strand:- start:494 stop:865 length:372 start_codon:yes stop_codon:yes gene_type:complete